MAPAPTRYSLFVLVLFLAAAIEALDFTVAGGQVYTPGFAIVDAPQPGTPLGGDYLQIALDVTADGQLPLPGAVADDSPSRFHNITIFLYSYDTNRNFTITNGTATPDGAALGPVLDQEQGSTVKHVNWVWPACLVGSGSQSADRGDYNISIRQSFRLNDVDHYTVFDLPIAVSNSIDLATANTISGIRPSCDTLDNPLLSPEQINATAANAVGIFLAPGSATHIDVQEGTSEDQQDGLGPQKSAGGLGSAASRAVMLPPSLLVSIGCAVLLLLLS